MLSLAMFGRRLRLSPGPSPALQLAPALVPLLAARGLAAASKAKSQPPADEVLKPPKKPKSVWQLFFMDEVARQRAANSEEKPSAIMKDAAARYQMLKQNDELAKYAEAVKADKARYEREMADYKTLLGEPEEEAPKLKKPRAKKAATD